MKMDSIEIIARQYDIKAYQDQHLQSKGEASFLSKEQNKVAMIVGEVPLNTLTQSLSAFTVEMDKILGDAQSESKKYILEEIEVSVDISASGSIRLIGSVEAGASGGLKLTFKRNRYA